MHNALKHLFILAFALVFMAGTALAQKNVSDITQQSNNNDATVTQSGAELKATVVQKGGNQNKATLNQFNDPAEMASVESTIRQVGFNNNAIANVSRKNASGVISSQRQVGNNNDAFINANGNIGSNLGNGMLSQTQLGNRNLARMSGSDSYSAEQYQDGSDNVALTSGNGKNANVFQRQIGDRNRAELNGAGFGFATSEQIQLGNDNRSLLNDVGHDGPGESYFNRQDGNDNLTRLDANGYGGVLDVRQTNDMNTARVTWNSALNQTTITQNGFSNKAVVDSN